MEWQHIAEEQAITIEGLAKLCHELLSELSQYKTVENEEKRLSELIKEE